VINASALQLLLTVTCSAACKTMTCRRNISSCSDGVAPQTLASVNDFKMIRWCFSRQQNDARGVLHLR